jgi:hypothetical protein
MNIWFPPCILYVSAISYALIWSPKQYLVKGIFYNLLSSSSSRFLQPLTMTFSLRPQIFSSNPRSQTPSANFLPLCWEIKSTTDHFRRHNDVTAKKLSVLFQSTDRPSFGDTWHAYLVSVWSVITSRAWLALASYTAYKPYVNFPLHG